MRRVAVVAAILGSLLAASDDASARGAGGARGGRAHLLAGHVRPAPGFGHLGHLQGAGPAFARAGARAHHRSSFPLDDRIAGGPVGWHYSHGHGWRRHGAEAFRGSRSGAGIAAGVAAVVTATGTAYQSDEAP